MKELSNFVRALRTAPAFAHFIMIITLAIWIVKAVWLDLIPATNPAFVGLGRVVEGLLSAIVAGYVFYILFAIYPEYRQRRIIAPFLFGRIRNVVGDSWDVINKIEVASGLGIPFATASERDVERAFSATLATIPPHQIVNSDGSPITWPGYFTYRYERTLSAIDELFQQGRYLDADVAALLTTIRNAPFYRMSKMAAGAPMTNPDLSAWGPGFYKLLKDCRHLAKWHDTHRMAGDGALIAASVKHELV